MKSTMKIDYSSRYEGGIPVIKIIQPEEYLSQSNNEAIDHDPKDKMIRDFLHSPCMNERNYWFMLNNYFPVPSENPTHHLTTISPVKESDLFWMFQNAILNRLVPVETIQFLNNSKGCDKDSKRPSEIREDVALKINEFFDYLSNLEYCTNTDFKE